MTGNRNIYRVQPNPTGDGWRVDCESGSVQREFASKADAVAFAGDRARVGGYRVHVHKQDGSLEYESTYGWNTEALRAQAPAEPSSRPVRWGKSHTESGMKPGTTRPRGPFVRVRLTIARTWVWEVVSDDGHVVQASEPFADRTACEAGALQHDLPVVGLSKGRPGPERLT